MSKLRDLVSRGVRMIVTEAGAEQPAEAAPPIESFPAETFVESPPPPPPRSEVPADVESFDAVYSEAGIALPPHGYGVDRVGEMLANKRLAPLSREVKAQAVLAALEVAGVAAVDVVQDAVRRDRALDAFEAAKAAEVDELKAQGEARIQALRDEIDAFLRTKNEEIEGIKQALEKAGAAVADLRARKAREEDRLYEVIAHFAQPSENPITRGIAAAPAPPSPPSPPPPPPDAGPARA